MARKPFTLASIQSRVLLVVLVALVLMLGGLGTISWLAVRQSTQASLEERLALAQANADHLSYVLRENLATLQSVASAPGVVDITAANPAEQQALHDAFNASIFDAGLYVVDAQGKIIMQEPEISTGETMVGSQSPVMQALRTGKLLVSDVYEESNGKKMVSAVVPVSEGGVVAGAIVGDIDPAGATLSGLIPPFRLGETGYVEVIDHGGTVVASSLSQHVLENSDHAQILSGLIDKREATSGTCHSCHQGTQSTTKQTEVMAFAPLQEQWVNWGVAVRQSESEALAPSRSLLRGILIVGIATLLVSIMLAWGMAQSVSRPIVSLTGAARRLSDGDLSRPIPASGRDEVGTLSRSIESMRSKLKASLEEIKGLNASLESKVEERTRELERLYQELRAKEAAREELLRKVITVQEDERKRVARDLHDDTSQTLAALVMKLDTYQASLMAGGDEAKLEEIREAARKSLDSIRRVILDLRPSILDDLGLVPALLWYAETRLREHGVKLRMETNDYDKRLPSEVETALFRIVQEAVTNIIRHAEAEHALIAVDFQDRAVSVEVEDDGKGFEVGGLTKAGAQTFGLHGIEERVTLLGGKYNVESHPGAGTRIDVSIPLNVEEEQGGRDTSAHSG